MNDLIQALMILQKYLPEKGYSQLFPTWCEHDLFGVFHIEEGDVSKEDAEELSKLGFQWVDEHESWCSFRFGSC